MREIKLNPVEKQSLSVLIDNVLFELSFKLCNNIMAATIVRDGVTVIENRRIVAGVGLIPEGDREEGNFIILTDNDELPLFSQFATTSLLVYADEEETDELRRELNQIVIRKPVKTTVVPKPPVKQPAITTQPTGKTVAAFSPLTLSVVADNAVSYQWRKDGIIVGDNSATYTDNDAQPSDSGKYKVIVTGEKYSSAVASDEVDVVVTPPPAPTFKTQPTALVQPTAGPYAGKKVVVWAAGQPLIIDGAEGNFTSTYQWQWLDPDTNAWLNIPSQQAAKLSVGAPKETSYRLIISNATGSATSDEFSAFEAFLFMQNDSATGAGTKYSLKKIDDSHYEMVDPEVSSTTTRYLGAFVRRTDTPAAGVDGIAVANPKAATSNAAVATATAGSGRQVTSQIKAVGSATITVSFGPLTSYINIEVK